MTDVMALKERLAERTMRLVVELLGEPTARGERYWRWSNQASFSYDFDQQCWRCIDTGDCGDLLDLIQYVNPGWDFARAVEWAVDWVGDPDRRGLPSPGVRLARLKSAGTLRALESWQRALPARGSPVEADLAARGLRLPDGSGEALRFEPASPGAQERRPAMLALVRGIVTDRPLGVCRVLLGDGGGVRAGVESGATMVGRVRGGVVKLTPEEDVTLGLTLAIGIEDGLALLNGGYAPVWACLSPGAMAQFPVLGGVEAMTIGVAGDSRGREAAALCADRWRAAGREVFVIEPAATRPQMVCDRSAPVP